MVEFIAIIVIFFGGWFLYEYIKAAKDTDQFYKKHYGKKKVTGDRIFYSKIAGVTYKNKDGTSRQDIVQDLSKGDILHLIPDPNNKHDKNAVKVLTNTREKVGYLPSEHASQLQHEIRGGKKFFAQVTDVTGGGWGKDHGVNIAVYKAEI